MHPSNPTHITQMSDFLKVFLRFQLIDLGSARVAFWRLSKVKESRSTTPAA
jgi:hypothetical protein